MNEQHNTSGRNWVAVCVLVALIGGSSGWIAWSLRPQPPPNQFDLPPSAWGSQYENLMKRYAARLLNERIPSAETANESSLELVKRNRGGRTYRISGMFVGDHPNGQAGRWPYSVDLLVRPTGEFELQAMAAGGIQIPIEDGKRQP